MPYVPDGDAIARPLVDLVALAREQAADRPWRLALVGDDGVRAVLLGWPPGFATIPHHHPHASELFAVQAGRLGFRLADHPEVELGAGTFLVARPYELHGLRVLGSEPAILLAIVGPNEDRPDETIDVPDAWPDWAGAPPR
ncbi:MAG: cupin domain-containing protein [Chloroflexota bacterium]